MKERLRHSRSAKRCWWALTCGALNLFLIWAHGQEATPIRPTPTVLTNVPHILSLSRDAADGQFEARFQGIVIYVSSLVTRRLYVQSGEHGVQVNLQGGAATFRAGQRVEVTGQVIGGLPQVRLANATVTVLGEGPLPEAKSVSAYQLAAAGDPFRLVRVRAVLRDMVSTRSTFTALLTEKALPFELIVSQGALPLPRGWLDAEIEVTGISYPFFNARGQPTTFRLHASDFSFIRVLSTGVTNVFDRPLLSVADAAARPHLWQPRLRIAGTVLLHRPGGALYVDDGTGVMDVLALSPLSRPVEGESVEVSRPVFYKPGDRVEVVGVRHNWYALAPTLIHAQVRKLGEGPAVQPRRVSIRDLNAGRFPAHLVKVRARLLDARGWGTGLLQHQTLVLQSGEDVFHATWVSESPAQWNLSANSYVDVTGVNEVESGQFTNRITFQLLMRSPADVATATAPPIWERPEIRKPLLAVAIVGLIAGAFILFQRLHLRRLERRVAERTTDLTTANTRLHAEVAARERAEADLRVALDAEKELGQLRNSFVSMVSHQFRTPLGAILSSAEILDYYNDKVSPEKRRAHFQTIHDAVQRMSGLVDEVLLFNRSEAGRMEFRPAPLDVPALCRQLVDEVHSATSCRCPITFDSDGASPSGYGDERLLRHILTNLLDNAVKYSPPGSDVTLTLRCDGPSAIFGVRDRGPGIPAADQAKLFTPFHRGSNVRGLPGTGLGLVMAKRCAERHGGNLSVQTAETGTTITVRLPLFAPPGHAVAGDTTTVAKQS